ncbi:peptide chain release factor N(5)-glutamine methyltransferase [Novosphingobium sp. B 225]|uniref:peptide chain release factor N(5)-glutamine methyltransferase n=1 Tax=Novosphingobium sp. B 225 TaxID=1961849 RepID=UPI0020CDA0E6|nr:peptide chain release factor N(5)-glutamine methyltransferase [Novosphingobium sp. B 225]
MSLDTARTVDEAVRAATQMLGPRTDTARFDAEVLMAHALGVSRSELFLRRMGDAPPPHFAELVLRRAGHEPVAHIVGSVGFWGLDFVVTPHVLIPRGDSETLIEAAVQAFAGAPPRRVLDLGTGSGCLLLAALHEWPDAEAVGIDRSDAALAVATDNARRLPGTNGPARLLRRDWTQGGWAQGLGQFDLVLANPPYVEDEAALEPSVRDHEPGGALFAGPEGLDDYRLLLPQLPALLTPGGIAMVEIGASQAPAVEAIAAAAGFTATLHLDLADRPRALELKIPLGKAGDSA